MIVFVMIYALVAMALFQARPLQDANLFIKTVLYAVIGLGWVLPLMPLIRWMEPAQDPSAPDARFPFPRNRARRRNERL